MDKPEPSAADVAYDDIVSGMREQDEYRTLAGMAGLAHAAAVNVGRIADALEAIAKNTAPTIVNNHVEPSREFIGMPAERD